MMMIVRNNNNIRLCAFSFFMLSVFASSIATNSTVYHISCINDTDCTKEDAHMRCVSDLESETFLVNANNGTAPSNVERKCRCEETFVYSNTSQTCVQHSLDVTTSDKIIGSVNATNNTDDDNNGKFRLHPEIITWIGVTCFLVVACILLTKLQSTMSKRKKQRLSTSPPVKSHEQIIAENEIVNELTTPTPSPSTPSSLKPSRADSPILSKHSRANSSSSIYLSIGSSISDSQDYLSCSQTTK